MTHASPLRWCSSVLSGLAGIAARSPNGWSLPCARITPWEIARFSGGGVGLGSRSTPHLVALCPFRIERRRDRGERRIPLFAQLRARLRPRPRCRRDGVLSSIKSPTLASTVSPSAASSVVESLRRPNAAAQLRAHSRGDEAEEARDGKRLLILTSPARSIRACLRPQRALERAATPMRPARSQAGACVGDNLSFVYGCATCMPNRPSKIGGPMPGRRWGDDGDSRARQAERRFAIEGEGWSVREDLRPSPHGPALVFENTSLARRVHAYPLNWRDLSDEELCALSWRR